MLILIFAAAAILLAGSVIIFRHFSKKCSALRRCALFLLCAVVFFCGLEISLFNINYHTSRKYEETDISDQLSKYRTESGEYDIPGGTVLTFSDINTQIKNIKIDCAYDSNTVLNTGIYLTDKANKNYFAAPERAVYPSYRKSQTINIHTSGVSKDLAISLSDSSGTNVRLNGIHLNVRREFSFDLLRIIALTAIAFFIYIFKPSSFIYKRKMNENKELTSALMKSFIFIEFAVIIVLASANPVFMGISRGKNGGIEFTGVVNEAHGQYDELAQAFIKGRLFIDDNDIPESLIKMENPYDTNARAINSEITGDHYRWDVSFFNGHYYVYFGIIPCLMMYLPFRIIFNAPFPTAIGIIIFAGIFTVGIYMLLKFIAEKKYPDTSIGSYLLLSFVFVNCCGAMFLVKRPDFYGIPIITGMSFVIWGIFCWLRSFDSKRTKTLMFFGSLFMALAVGCRPQFALLSFTAIPIFFERYLKNKGLRKKGSFRELAVLGSPYIAVAALLCIYNYLRFGSPFDFGSTYNLTTNDVTARGFDPGRTGLGIFTYLFQTPVFTATFPFIKKVGIDTNYIGKTVRENCFGGLITSLPVLWFLFAVKGVSKKLKEKKMLASTLLFIALGFVIVIADTQAGGLLQRYFSDFGFVFFLAVYPIILSLIEKYDSDREKKNLLTLVFISSLAAIFYSICLAFSVSDVTIDTKNPTLFAQIAYAVQFWL